MGLFSSKDDDAVRAYKDARKALEKNSRDEKKAGIRDETDTYLELNARVNETAQNVPWYRR